ncbi:hypothetical protein LTR27_000497 [Elasticomyces elasticus]|nr:hypothetical protein LTR27_000497 [Elasticomyces elasticus]
MAEQPDPALTKVEPVNGAADPKINFAGLDSAVKRVNALLAAAMSIGSLDPDVRARHEALRTDVDNARDALVKATSQVALATSTLSQAASDESIRLPSTLEDFDWYESIDFFACPPEDGDDFGDYVSRVTNARMEDYAKKHGVRDTTFARKALQLICALLATGEGAFAGLHHLVWTKRELLRSEYDTTVTTVDVTTLCEPVDKAIEWLLQRKPEDPAATFKLCAGLEFECKYVPDYFNVAYARRALYEDWTEHDCHEDENVEYDEHEGPFGLCWHKRNQALLVLLNQRAYQEVKKCVWLATQHVMPPELIEEVFEYTLLEEEVPIDADLRTKLNPWSSQCKEEYKVENCSTWW